MSTKLTLELNDEQALGLMALAARTSSCVETIVMGLVNDALLTKHLPAGMTLEELLVEIQDDELIGASDVCAESH
ncbi:hypothetical protein [Reyranella sp.]|uniref:hypothetical protein n=1 Tax=Reyranella sp. TaxID=1929291 RepID=UPI002720F0F2|nr:hypothetical protein [Reyranella sp.]MDO8973876.1 hypothetical protein [Reyranella sp.]